MKTSAWWKGASVWCGIALGCALAFTVAAARTAVPQSAVATQQPVLPSTAATPLATLSPDDERRLEELEHRTFDYFWETANPSNGLVPDNYPNPKNSSIAAIGFALSSYIIGAQRHYITRQQALERSTQVLAFLASLPECGQSRGCARYHGFYYHFLDLSTGLRYRNSELSTIDTTLLLAGVLSVEQYFDGDSAAEANVRALAQSMYDHVDWPFATHPDGAVSMGWSPEKGLYPESWTGYNEAMLLVVLGLGSRTHPLPANAWSAWCRTYARFWKREYGEQYLSFPALFVHQYSHVWIDFRGIQDAFTARHHFDYFENSRRAVLAQYRYAKANPHHYKDYGAPLWGVTASDGPDVPPAATDRAPRFYGYAGRGFGGPIHLDDGTIAPTGALASLPFAPELVLPTLAALPERYPDLYQAYGFLDAINPSVASEAAIGTGRWLPQEGWVDDQFLGIDQGPILIMTENFRSQWMWQLMRQHPAIRQGLKRAGFKGGWLEHP